MGFLPKSMRGKVVLLLVLIVCIPMLISSYILQNGVNNALLKEKEAKLMAATRLLDQYLIGDFDQILRKKGAEHADHQTKIRVLHEELKAQTDLVAQAFPNIGVGYYVKDLEAIVTYGPSQLYDQKVGVKIAQNHPGNSVLESGKDLTKFVSAVRGNVMNAMHPIIRDGRVIGYIWANEPTDMVEKQLSSIRHTIVGILLGVIVFIIFLLVSISNRIIRDVNIVKEGLHGMEKDLSIRISGVSGEIGEIATAVNRMAHSLQNEKSLTENILNSITEGMITLDHTGCITSANPAALEMTGLTLSDLIGKQHDEFFQEGCHISNMIVDTMRTGRRNIEMNLNFSIGEQTIYASASTSFLNDSNHHPIGILLILWNMKEVQQLQQQVLRAGRLAALGELMAWVAHEVRNPLTSIKGFVQYLQDTHTEEEREEFMTIIVKEVNRINRIIEELLYFSKHRPTHYTSVDVNQLMKQTLILVEHRTAQAQVMIFLDLDPDNPIIRGDADQCKQVFLNIIINAIQAIEDQGELHIKTRLDVDKQYVEIIFHDSGCGFVEDDLQRAFDPFYTTKEKGTGLGLAVAMQIITAHNGWITLDNHEMKGAVVTISLPVLQLTGGDQDENESITIGSR
ncbi:two-component system sensor histidine kinase AtoS [Brevibacillus ginsengisoli]|uniref:two-component system sensor histidine kinase AtoS n=1 Tax=Brevibacillus ginsengisoli TaxID=363854 RepID=UPI003CE898AE